VARPQILSLPERLDAHPDFTGKGVCIAFIDVGFYPHPDLMQPRRRIRAYADVARNSASASELFTPQGTSWHGTMTACCAAGNGYVSGGHYRGLACESDVVLLRAGTAEGRVLGKNVASAIRFPLRHPELEVRIVSVSLGVNHDDPHAADVEAAVAEATEAGITVFAAAGNDPRSAPEPPASAREAITVGGSNDQNTRAAGDDTAWPSSHAAGGAPKPDLLAPAIWLPAPMLPGTQVAREAGPLFTLLGLFGEMTTERRFFEGRTTPEPEDRTLTALIDAIEARIARQKFVSPDYQHVDGTSFAAPIAASIAAQMLEANPALTPALIRRGLTSTAALLPGVPAAFQGAGVLRPRQAVEWAIKKR
jgi:serine protease AprX